MQTNMGNIDNINKTMTTVSVVIPCVNEVNTIRHCIESVTSSSGNNIKLEIVVVDGGSDDGALKSCLNFKRTTIL